MVFFGKRRFGFASVVVAASLEASASAADTVVASVLVVVAGLAKLLLFQKCLRKNVRIGEYVRGKTRVVVHSFASIIKVRASATDINAFLLSRHFIHKCDVSSNSWESGKKVENRANNARCDMKLT
jgi:hypothetical protein